MKIFLTATAIIIVIGLLFYLGTNTDESNTFQETPTDTVDTPTDDVEHDESDTDIELEVEATSQAEVVPDEAVPIDDEPATHVFNIEGFNYGFSVEEIRVQQGDTVTINFTSTDSLHDIVIDEFDVATKKIGGGNSDSVTFVADQAGTFEYYCSVGQHRVQGMVGTLIVE